MVTFDVDHLMTHHSRQLIGAMYPVDQAGLDINGTSGHGKSVEFGIFNHEKSVIELLRSHRRKNAAADLVNVAVDLKIAHKLELLLGFQTKLAADFCLLVFLIRQRNRALLGLRSVEGTSW